MRVTTREVFRRTRATGKPLARFAFPNSHTMKLIKFEDHSQDFTSWIVDKKGRVVACAPFQADIWGQGRVGNLADLHVGEQVLWHKPGNEPLFIKYPVISITDVPTAEDLIKQHGKKLVGCYVLTISQVSYPGGITKVLRVSGKKADKFEFVVEWQGKDGFSLTPKTPVHFIGKSS